MKDKKHGQDDPSEISPGQEQFSADETERQDVPDINADENMSGTSHLNDWMATEPEVEKLQEEIQELKDKYLRQVAEFDNYRKRILREKEELRQTAGKEVIEALLDVMDDFDRATQQMETATEVGVVKEGALLIFNKLKKILQARGVREMDSLHADFDPELHDAITEIPAPNEALKGKVLDNMQKGYYLNDKLIRHAKVVIGK